jgi:hypothetical protein
VLAAWETRRRILERHPWWQPFELAPVLGLAAQLLAAGDAVRAERLFAMATEVYPDEVEARQGLTRAREAACAAADAEP